MFDEDGRPLYLRTTLEKDLSEARWRPSPAPASQPESSLLSDSDPCPCSSITVLWDHPDGKVVLPVRLIPASSPAILSGLNNVFPLPVRLGPVSSCSVYFSPSRDGYSPVSAVLPGFRARVAVSTAITFRIGGVEGAPDSSWAPGLFFPPHAVCL